MTNQSVLLTFFCPCSTFVASWISGNMRQLFLVSQAKVHRSKAMRSVKRYACYAKNL